MNKNPTVKTIAFVTFGIDLLAIAIAISRAILLQRSPMRYFGEGGFVTWLSIIQLLIISVLCWKISILRKVESKSSLSIKKQPAIFWQICAVGMFFFALDEWLEIHEKLDVIIHQWMQKEITSFSGRLDDLIVLFYAITGVFIIYLFKNEFKNFFASFPWFICGFFCSVLTILLDMIGHNRDTFAIFADNLDQLNQIHHWIGTAEEIPKIFAGGAFLIAFFHCQQIASNIKQEKLNSRVKYSSKISL